ncbi:MAG: type II toxin-antitoxin system RelE/ParE family toxin [Cellvibrionaceae bacterium]
MLSKFRNRFSNSSRSKHKVSEAGLKLYVSSQAQNVIDQAGSHDKLKINQAIQNLAGNPRPDHAGKRIKASGAYRIAVGHYRLDYVIYSGQLTITEVSLDGFYAERPKHERPGLYKLTEGSKGKWESSFRPVTRITSSYAAVNGIQNTLDRAMKLMPTHVKSAFGRQVKEFTLFHNPSVGFLGDLWESARDKLSISTELAQQLAAILDDAQKDKQPVKWVVHSQGGVIFSEAVKKHNKTKGTSLNLHQVQFHSGANNARVTQKALDKAGIKKIGPDNNHPFDLVPNVIGLNTVNPIKFLGSIVAAPALSDLGPLRRLKSPHTLPNARENWKFWQWKD